MIKGNIMKSITISVPLAFCGMQTSTAQNQNKDTFENLNEIVLVAETLGTEGYWDYDDAKLDQKWLKRITEIKDREKVNKRLIAKISDPKSTIGAIRVLNTLNPGKAVNFHVFATDGSLIHASIPLKNRRGDTVMITVSPSNFRTTAKAMWRNQLFPPKRIDDELNRLFPKKEDGN